MKNILSLLGLGVCAIATGATTITPTLTQSDPAKIEISYRLSGETAVVTANIETNSGQNVWVRMDDSFTTNLMGDVNMKLADNTEDVAYRAYLNLAEALPGVKLSANQMRINLEVWKLDALPDFMAVSLVDSGTIKFYRSAAAVPGGIADNRYKGDWILMRKIPAAGVVWTMGDGVNGDDAKSTKHKVTLTADYFLAVYETTYRQFTYVYRALGAPSCNAPDTCWSKEKSVASGENRDYMPIGYVCWDELRGAETTNTWTSVTQSSTVSGSSFFNRLRRYTGLMEFDLPTEAQWEYACHAGTSTTYHTGDDPELAGWALDYPTTIEGKGTKHEVGKLSPNAFGLYDMHGNVGEWCLDVYQVNLGSSAAIDPPGGMSGGQRAIRGGCFSWPLYRYGRSAGRYRSNSIGRYTNIGFRLAMPARLSE